jgi:predicted GTPase
MKYKYRVIVSIVFFVVSFCMLCQANTGRLGTPLFNGERNRESRVQYAKELSSFFKKIDESIPSLSPSQREWLEKELRESKKTKNFYREVEVFNTKEYNIHVVKMKLKSWIGGLNLVIQEKQLNREVYIWSVIAEELVRTDFWSSLHVLMVEHNLVDKNLFCRESDEKIDQYMFYLANAISPTLNILKYIIQPYLKGELLN